MLTAERMSMWRGRYQVKADGRPVAVWDPSWWRTGGDFGDHHIVSQHEGI